MDEQLNVKEKMIQVTIELVQESNGAVSEVTSRKIATRAGVGLGLINYHFGSKEQLIKISVQRIINQIVSCFKPTQRVYSTEPKLADQERLTDWAKQVFDFLYDHSAISTISILGDMQNYHPNCNSVNTQNGFRAAIQNDSNEEEKRILVFMLTSAMQISFLQGEAAKEIIGYNLRLKEERDHYIELMIELLFKGIKTWREE